MMPRLDGCVLLSVFALTACAVGVQVEEHPYGGESSGLGGSAGIFGGGTGGTSTGGTSSGGTSSGGTSTGGVSAGGSSTGGTSSGGASTGGTSTGGTSTGGTSTGGTSTGGTSGTGGVTSGSCDSSSATEILFQSPRQVPTNSCVKMAPAGDETWAKNIIIQTTNLNPSVPAAWSNCTKSGNATLAGNGGQTTIPIDVSCPMYLQLGGTTGDVQLTWWLGS